MPAQREPHLATVEGHRVLVIDRDPPIPGSLSLLLEGGRDEAGRPWAPLRVVVQYPLRLGGARSACLEQDHRLKPWLEGFATGSDLQNRYLHIHACQDCGSVCVRDASFDTLEAHDPTGRGAVSKSRLAPRRRDHVIGWYSGARPNQRTYS